MKRFLKGALRLGKTTLSDFGEDGGATLAAALAYYAGLSFAPLVLLLVSVAGLAGEGATDAVVGQVRAVVGPEAGKAVSLVVEGAKEDREEGAFAVVVGGLALLVSAAGAFAQLQASLNRVWEVRARPKQGFRGWLRKRLLSVGMVLAVGFLLVVSLGVSAALSWLLSGATGVLWAVVDVVLSLAVLSLLFALLFQYVPDARVPWRVVRTGAVLTAALFLVGKAAIGLYLGRSAVGSAYGAAGSLVVLLVWVYYCSIVLFLGAEATQAHARLQGVEIRPSRHAVRVVEDGKST